MEIDSTSPSPQGHYIGLLRVTINLMRFSINPESAAQAKNQGFSVDKLQVYEMAFMTVHEGGNLYHGTRGYLIPQTPMSRGHNQNQ